LRVEGPIEHALGPARGLLAGLSLSVLLWSALGGVIILVLV
jgi:hypothetical protein